MLLQYQDESDLQTVMRLIDNELSEPYSIFTYRCELHRCTTSLRMPMLHAVVTFHLQTGVFEAFCTLETWTKFFLYRYFLRTWPDLCWLAYDDEHCFGTVVCKKDDHRGSMRGYLAMLVVEKPYRALGVGEILHSSPRSWTSSMSCRSILQHPVQFLCNCRCNCPSLV